jgi:Beta/Gamma crystallin
VSFSQARLLALRTAAFMTAAIAGISYATMIQAAPPPRAVPVRAAPAPHFAPRAMPARPAPQMHAAPQFRANRPAVAPRISQPQRNFHAVTPNMQHGVPGGQFNRPNFQHAAPGGQHFNSPGGQNFQHANPGGARPVGAVGATMGGGLNRGPGQALASPAGMRQGPGGFQQVRPGFPAVSMGNRFWPIQKGPKFMWVGGYRRFFVPVGLLGVALIGGSYWYPDGYVSIAGPACYGITPEGCQLQWRMVDFEDGGGEPQCVQYCPQAGPPPANAAPLPPPPALMQTGNCQATIFSDPNFGGLSAPTSDNQPVLSQTGWQNEISSIQIQAGTWDFFTGENFGGESMRLTAGQYGTLAPEWTKKIGSFMCVAPGAPGA